MEPLCRVHSISREARCVSACWPKRRRDSSQGRIHLLEPAYRIKGGIPSHDGNNRSQYKAGMVLVIEQGATLCYPEPQSSRVLSFGGGGVGAGSMRPGPFPRATDTEN